MMKYKLLFLLFLPTAVFSQSAKELLTELQNKYKSVNSFTASFNQVTRNGIEKNEFNSSGKIYFKKKNKIRVELKEQLLISDGKTVWNYNKKQNKVIISNNEAEPSVLSLDKFILGYPAECEASFTGKQEQKIILLTPKKKNAPFKEIKIYPDNSSILTKIEFTDTNGNYFSFGFTDVKLDGDIKDSQFMFTAPKGIRTVDLR